MIGKVLMIKYKNTKKKRQAKKRAKARAERSAMLTALIRGEVDYSIINHSGRSYARRYLNRREK